MKVLEASAGIETAHLAKGMSLETAKDNVKRTLVHKIAEELLKQGYVNFEEKLSGNVTVITAKLIVKPNVDTVAPFCLLAIGMAITFGFGFDVI